jgi:hypothetical protein
MGWGGPRVRWCHIVSHVVAAWRMGLSLVSARVRRPSGVQRFPTGHAVFTQRRYPQRAQRDTAALPAGVRSCPSAIATQPFPAGRSAVCVGHAPDLTRAQRVSGSAGRAQPVGTRHATAGLVLCRSADGAVGKTERDRSGRSARSIGRAAISRRSLTIESDTLARTVWDLSHGQ